MRRFLLFILWTLFLWNTVSAKELPFTDVQKTDNFYEWVQNLYNFGIISDDGSHLFRPADPINRDILVSIATRVSCGDCLTPEGSEYRESSFVDLDKSNPYYSCIAYASEKNIIQWYSLNADGSFTCENGEKYTSSPFCETNKTSRIEAAAILLRQAQLWDDAKNTGYIKKINITDVSDYWQGYAEKWIAAGILTLWSDNSIHPNDLISRGEFAMMAGKMLTFNQCRAPENHENTTDSDGDSMNDDVDLCIMVQWPASNNGCPVIKIGWYGNIVDTLLRWEWWGASGWNDSDGDGIIDSQDFCMNSSGSTLYHGCSSASILSGITKNKCLNNQLNTRGLMIATPVCNTCPCENSIDMVSLARTCDVLFPAILSPDQSNIYARWGFYQIQ